MGRWLLRDIKASRSLLAQAGLEFGLLDWGPVKWRVQGRRSLGGGRCTVYIPVLIRLITQYYRTDRA